VTTQDEPCEIVITAPDPTWLANFSRQLVVDRLCAAVHNISPIRSTYWWQGQLHDEVEARVSLHTRTTLVSPIVERTNREHPYEVPCVAVLPIAGGNPAYIEWIIRETQGVNA
jgi:periplasmic divalent cation tolerance protein